MIYRLEWMRPLGRITRFDFSTRDGAERYATGLTTGSTRIIVLGE